MVSIGAPFSFEVIQVACLKDNYSYLLVARSAKRSVTSALYIDPTEANAVAHALRSKNANLEGVLCTHHHPDHVGGNLELQAKFNCPIYVSEIDGAKTPGQLTLISEKAPIIWRGLEVKVLAVPGHTHGHLAFYIPELRSLFCGDTLFSNGCGRLFEGTYEDLFQSLVKLKELPKDTWVYCAHEYTEVNSRFAKSVDPDNEALQNRFEEVRRLRAKGLPTVPSLMETERQTNPFLRCNTVSEFKKMRELRNVF